VLTNDSLIYFSLWKKKHKMMKKLVLISLLLLNTAMAQVKKGESVPDLNFKTLLNAPSKQVNLSALKGKVVIIEFWATWCGACLNAMPHLNQLQKAYPKQVQVITVSSESEKRIATFIKSRPSVLWSAVDTAETVSKLFPHQLIPHSVVISPEGKLIATTNPESITALVIDSILKEKQVHLPEKTDLMYGSPEELMLTVFPLPKRIEPRFLMQKEIKGAPGFSTTYPLDSIFKGKRITAVNLGISDLYRLAYGSFGSKRVVDSTSATDKENAYCVDLIVEKNDQLLPAFQQELLKRFDVKAKIVKQLKDVEVLKIIDPDKFKKIALNTNGKRSYFARHGEIDQQSITMADFASYLESYGSRKHIVMDETNSSSKYDIKFSFQPENPSSLEKQLFDMGLILEKKQQLVDVLMIYHSK